MHACMYIQTCLQLFFLIIQHHIHISYVMCWSHHWFAEWSQLFSCATVWFLRPKQSPTTSEGAAPCPRRHPRRPTGRRAPPCRAGVWKHRICFGCEKYLLLLEVKWFVVVHNGKKERFESSGWFQAFLIFLMFKPILGDDDSNWRTYISGRLKPPTR